MSMSMARRTARSFLPRYDVKVVFRAVHPWFGERVVMREVTYLVGCRTRAEAIREARGHFVRDYGPVPGAAFHTYQVE